MIRSDRYRLLTLRYTFPVCFVFMLIVVWTSFFEIDFDIYNLLLSIGVTIAGIVLSYINVSMIRSALIFEDGITIDGETIFWRDILKVRTSWFLIYRVSTSEGDYYFAPAGFLFTFFGLILWGDEMYGVFVKRGFLQSSAFNF